MYTQSMKRIVGVFFLFIFLSVFPVSAATPSPTGPNINISTSNTVLPGINCGVAGDTDPTKQKCCIQKSQDDSVMKTFLNEGAKAPIIGGFVNGIKQQSDALDSIKDKGGPCTYGIPSTPNSLTDPACVCIKEASSSAIPAFNNFCDKYFPQNPNPVEQQRCMQCMETEGGFYTSLGCIPLDMSSFITNYILKIGIGFAGGLALLCIFYSAFRMQTSLGNAEAIKKAQENLTACITGLIIVIFSVLILKIIGVDILRIPGLQ